MSQRYLPMPSTSATRCWSPSQRVQSRCSGRDRFVDRGRGGSGVHVPHGTGDHAPTGHVAPPGGRVRTWPPQRASASGSASPRRAAPPGRVVEPDQVHGAAVRPARGAPRPRHQPRTSASTSVHQQLHGQRVSPGEDLADACGACGAPPPPRVRSGTTGSTSAAGPVNRARRRRATRPRPELRRDVVDQPGADQRRGGLGQPRPDLDRPASRRGGAVGSPRTCSPLGQQGGRGRGRLARTGVSVVAPSHRVASTRRRPTWTNSSSASGGTVGVVEGDGRGHRHPEARPARVVARAGTGGSVSPRPRTRRPATRRPGSAHPHQAAGRRHGAVASPRTTNARPSRFARQQGQAGRVALDAPPAWRRGATRASASPPHPAVRSTVGAPA